MRAEAQGDPLWALLAEQQAVWGPLAWGVTGQAGSEKGTKRSEKESEAQLVWPEDMQVQRFLKAYVEQAVSRVGKEEKAPA
jgi:hypothetical protein